MILLALGANLPSRYGTPAQTLRHIVQMLPRHGVRVVAASRHYRNPAVPASDQPDFINGIVRVETGLTPRQLMALCLRLENELGRKREGKLDARPLDLDLIDFDGLVSAEPELTLPHPRAHERAFVLMPLLEVAPHWVHPKFGRSGEALLADLDPSLRAVVKPLEIS